MLRNSLPCTQVTLCCHLPSGCIISITDTDYTYCVPGHVKHSNVKRMKIPHSYSNIFQWVGKIRRR